MCTVKINGYEVENSELVTKKLSEKFADQLKQFDVFSNAYVSSRMIANGHPWVIEARKGRQVAYIILEGYDQNNKRNAYFYTGPMSFPRMDSYELAFSSGNYQARLTRDCADKPVVYWKRLA